MSNNKETGMIKKKGVQLQKLIWKKKNESYYGNWYGQKKRRIPITNTGMSKKKEWVLLQKLVWVKKTRMSPITETGLSKKNKNESYYRNWYE